MSKYEKLTKYLMGSTEKEIILTFKDIEILIGKELPKSAYQYSDSWYNSHGGKLCLSWRKADYKTKDVSVNFQKEQIKFVYDNGVEAKSKTLVDELYKDIESASEVLGNPLKKDSGQIEIFDRGCPHEKPSLPKGCAAVYMFLHEGRFIKIGKVGVGNNSRFQYQHYEVRNAIKSSLAKSLLKDWDSYGYEIKKPDEIEDWMLKNLRRIDIIINCDFPDWATALIEGIMHYKYQPLYEGKNKKHKQN